MLSILQQQAFCGDPGPALEKCQVTTLPQTTDAKEFKLLSNAAKSNTWQLAASFYVQNFVSMNLSLEIPTATFMGTPNLDVALDSDWEVTVSD